MIDYIIKLIEGEYFMEEKSDWDSYVGMNQGYNAIFDNWQNIQGLLSSKTNREINMALNLLDSALDSVKAAVKKTGLKVEPVVLAMENESEEDESAESADADADEESGSDADNKEEKKGGGLFKIFGGKKK